MTRLEIDWPDEAAERVRVATGRLAAGSAALRSMSLEERLAAVARVLGDWTAADSPWRRELATCLADATPFSAGTVSEGLDSALRAWSPERFIECARAELASVSGGGARTLAPYEWTAVLAGGSIPMPTLLSALLPLVVGSPVLLRETSKDAVTAGLLARSLEARDERLAQSFEHLAFASTDQAAFERLLEAPCVVATGSDETIAAIAERISPSQRFVAYGHRFSIAILGPETGRDEGTLQQAVDGLAIDIARWDQSGCLSPVVVYLVGVQSDLAGTLARRLSEALSALSSAMPRGELAADVRAQVASERSEARMRAASGRGVSIEGEDHTVVLEADARARPAPLHRFVRLMPVDSTEELLAALAPFSGHLSSVALAGFAQHERNSDRRSEEHDGSIDRVSTTNRESTTDRVSTVDRVSTTLLEALSRLAVSRFTRPGLMQTPPVDWPHDGMPLFTPICRFTHFTESDPIGL